METYNIDSFSTGRKTINEVKRKYTQRLGEIFASYRSDTILLMRI